MLFIRSGKLPSAETKEILWMSDETLLLLETQHPDEQNQLCERFKIKSILT